ncbi:DUF4123 domain-containing protein [Robbsia andropogonis]|uniref:DUF4123 domain-containing protein n=2 Tax=Robbsia andropogonis TaxID=28092 RepID=UPI00209D0989|nr:DUF4123 domain-containing protein [Robbsia andropogonis]
MFDSQQRIRVLRSLLSAQFAGMSDPCCLLVVDPSAAPLERGPMARNVVDDIAPDADTAANNDGLGTAVLTFASLKRWPIPVPHTAFPPDQQPYLLALDLKSPQGRKLFERSIEIAVADRLPDRMARGAGQRIGGWIQASVAPADLARYWGRMTVQYDLRDRATLLRFYDNRSLALLWPLLTYRQRQALLGPVEVWWTLDAISEPVGYRLDTPSRTDAQQRLMTDAPPNTARQQQPLAILAEQWPHIFRHGVTNRAIAGYQFVGGGMTRQKVDIASRAAERAELLRLDDVDDATLFVTHALSWHPQFDEHPRVLEALRTVGPDVFYAEAISALTDAEIDDIRGGEWLSASQRVNEQDVVTRK